MYAPTFQSASGNWHGGGDNYGTMDATDKVAQLAYKGSVLGGNLFASIMGPFVPTTLTSAATNGVANAAFTDTDTYMPKLEAAMTYALGPVKVTGFGGYNAYSESNTFPNNPDGDKAYEIKSYVYGLLVTGSMGPISFKGNLWEGKNLYNYGYLSYSTTSQLLPIYDKGLDKILDVDSIGYGAYVSYKLSDMFLFGAGFGATTDRRDHHSQFNVADDWTSRSIWYVNAPISVTKFFTVVPEFDFINNCDALNNGAAPATALYQPDRGYSKVYLVYWKISF